MPNSNPLRTFARHAVFPGTLVAMLFVGDRILSSDAPPESVIVIWFGLMKLTEAMKPTRMTS